MNFEQSKKTWYNKSAGYIIKTVYNPLTNSYETEQTPYNKLPQPSKVSLPEALLNDVLDWRNVIRENRKND